MIQSIQNTRPNTNFGTAHIERATKFLPQMRFISDPKIKLSSKKEELALVELFARLTGKEFKFRNKSIIRTHSNYQEKGIHLKSKSGDVCTLNYKEGALNAPPDEIRLQSKTEGSLSIIGEKLSQTSAVLFSKICKLMAGMAEAADKKEAKAAAKAAKAE